jgi:hypothetical protein
MTDPSVKPFNLLAQVPTGIFVQTELPSEQRAVLFAPNDTPAIGEYELHEYGAMRDVAPNFEIYQALPKGSKPFLAKKKQDVVDALPKLYVFRPIRNFECLPTLLYSVNKLRASQLDLRRLRSDTIVNQVPHMKPQMMFRSQHLVVHHIPSMLTSIAVTRLGERMFNVLTCI